MSIIDGEKGIKTMEDYKNEVDGQEEEVLAHDEEVSDDEVLQDAKDFRDGKMTIEKLKTNPVEVEGDKALLISALHSLYSNKASREELDKALEDLKLIASHDDVYANTLLGVLYSEGGEATSVDLSLAESYLERGKELGGVVAEYRLGILYLQDNSLRNPEKGVDLVRSAAEKGLKEALNSLGDIYYKGVSVDKSVETAKKYYTYAANRKLGEAFHNLAKIALEENDEEKANELEEQAALYGFDKVNNTQNYLLLAYSR